MRDVGAPEDAAVLPTDLVPGHDLGEVAGLVLLRPEDAVLHVEDRAGLEVAPHPEHGSRRLVGARDPVLERVGDHGSREAEPLPSGTAKSWITDPTFPEARSRTTTLAW